MLLSTTTDFLEKNYGFKKAIDILSNVGYDAIDFSIFREEHYTDVHDKDFYLEIKKYAEDKGLIFNQAHAPFASSFPNAEESERRFEQIVTAMRNASYLGVKNIIVHPCQHLEYNEGNNPEILFEYNMNFYKRLIPYCEEYEIKVALENMWQYTVNFINHSTCSRPEEFIRYVDELNNDCFVACLDIGHAMLVREKPDDFIRKLGNKRLQCLHVHDVDGIKDLHTIPYFGMINWESVVQALADINYKGDFTFEADAFFKNKPMELHNECAEFMAKTGKHLVEKFKTIQKGDVSLNKINL